MLYYLFATLMLASCLLIRPSHLGEDYNVIGAAALFAIGLMAIATVKTERRIAVQLTPIAISNISIVTYLAIHAYANLSPSPFPIYALVCVTLSTMGAWACFSSQKLHDAFFDVLRAFLAIMTVSFLVTLALSVDISRPGSPIFGEASKFDVSHIGQYLRSTNFGIRHQNLWPCFASTCTRWLSRGWDSPSILLLGYREPPEPQADITNFSSRFL